MVLEFRAIILVLLSFAALVISPVVAEAQAALTLQAESMPIKTGGEISRNGAAWVINESGSISQPVTFAKGRYRLEVLARGTYIHDEWPVMQIKVDNAGVGISVASSDWSVYSVEVPLAVGTRSVSIELTNAHFHPETKKYRSLEIDHVSIDHLSDDNVSVPWSLTVVLMGPLDPIQQGELPVKEAVSFIEARTRFVFVVQYVTTYGTYDYTPYRCGPDKDGDGVGDEVAYLMMSWNIPKSVIDSLPVTSSYLFLYTLNGLRPLQAGSSLGVAHGILKGGKPRPYSSVPTDPYWYVNEPIEGFASHAAQILTHEIINTIQGKIEAAPYRCPQLTATWGLPPAQFESERLLKLTDACYEKLVSTPN